MGVRTPTRRRKTHKKVNLTPSVSSRRSATPAVQLREETPTLVDREQMQRAFLSGASATASYIVDVLATAFWLLKKPLGVLAFVVVLALLSGYVADKVRFVLSPLCIIPGISSSMLCVRPASTPSSTGKKPQSANFTKLVELQDNFEGIMTENVGTGAIGLKLKESEMATRDLVTLVRVSDLRSRDSLAEALTQFVEDAKKTGEGLHRLSAKINGAVDRITAVNDYAMHTIEAATNRGSFSLSRIVSRTNTETVVLRSFEDAMDTLAKETHRALLEASASAANLERLQEHLLTIHEICAREGVALSEAQAELLSELWTILGGNRSARRKNTMHLTLLKEIGRYRKEALAHVIVTRDALQAVAADVEELREHAAAPAIVGERVPAQVLIQSIGNGIERLKEGRKRVSERQQALMDRLLASPGNVLGIEVD